MADSQTFKGFVLQATYRVHQGVPVVYLFGRGVDGRTFVVRDHRQVPHFYIPQTHVATLVDDGFDPRVAGYRCLPCEFSTMDGLELARVEVAVPGDAPAVRDALHARGIQTYEADVRFAMRYLIDRQIRGGIAIRGEARAGRGVALRFDNPETSPADVHLEPRVLSFDIETDPRAGRLLAIACHGCGVDEVVVVDGAGRSMPAGAIGVPDEKAALRHFADLVRRVDADVLTGWNVIDFDLAELLAVARRVGFDLQLGREPGQVRIRAAEGYFGSSAASVPGRLVIDGMTLVRGAHLKFDDYSLDAVSRRVLGEGKTFGGAEERGDKVAEILRTYRHDLDTFTTYARTDARLVLDILARLDLIELTFARSALTGMPGDRVQASIASFDFLYLSELHRRRLAAPSVDRVAAAARVPQGGGAVFEPVVGVHDNVWVCDFKSLYPSIIRTFNIDPLAHAVAGTAEAVVRTEDGTPFAADREAAILPGMLDELFPARAAARARRDEVASQAIKILMNSFYGVLGTSACRFFNPRIANAITSQGRALLQWSSDWFSERGFQVLYGDTDSVFVASGAEDADVAAAEGPRLVSAFNEDLTAYLEHRFGVESRLELEFEKLYTRLFLASTRGGGQGARKRYAGLRHGSEDVEFVGMEVVRRDWTELAKRVQRNLFAHLFADPSAAAEAIAGNLKATVAALRGGELDDELVYRKGLRKAVDSYTTNVPPHVQAVKKSAHPAPRVVSYVMTVHGPELASEQSSPLDREHYLEKQVKPVAQPVLEVLGLVFDQVIGDDRQIDLF